MENMKTAYEVPQKLKDRLVSAVAHLTKHPEEIREAHSYPEDHKAGCLFRFVHKLPLQPNMERPDGKECGCLTMIRRGFKPMNVAYNKNLTAEIQRDKRIPTAVTDITTENLPFFHEWMLRLAVIFEWSE